MVDTVRTRAYVLATLFPDNTTGDISPQDLRDFVVSIMGVYGSIVIENGSTSQAFASGVPEVMTEWTGNGLSAGTTPDEANNKITILHDGVYEVKFHCSFQGNNPIVNEFELRVDGVATGLKCQRKTTSADIGSCSFVGHVSLTANEELSIWFEGDGASNFTAVEAGLVVHRIA